MITNLAKLGAGVAPATGHVVDPNFQARLDAARPVFAPGGIPRYTAGPEFMAAIKKGMTRDLSITDLIIYPQGTRSLGEELTFSSSSIKNQNPEFLSFLPKLLLTDNSQIPLRDIREPLKPSMLDPRPLRDTLSDPLRDTLREPLKDPLRHPSIDPDTARIREEQARALGFASGGEMTDAFSGGFDPVRKTYHEKIDHRRFGGDKERSFAELLAEFSSLTSSGEFPKNDSPDRYRNLGPQAPGYEPEYWQVDPTTGKLTTMTATEQTLLLDDPWRHKGNLLEYIEPDDKGGFDHVIATRVPEEFLPNPMTEVDHGATDDLDGAYIRYIESLIGGKKSLRFDHSNRTRIDSPTLTPRIEITDPRILKLIQLIDQFGNRTPKIDVSSWFENSLIGKGAKHLIGIDSHFQIKRRSVLEQAQDFAIVEAFYYLLLGGKINQAPTTLEDMEALIPELEAIDAAAMQEIKAVALTAIRTKVMTRDHGPASHSLAGILAVAREIGASLDDIDRLRADYLRQESEFIGELDNEQRLAYLRGELKFRYKP